MSKIFAFLWNWTKRFCAYFSRRDVPLWVTIVLAIGAAWGANVLVPKINQQHEYAKMKSSFILQSLNDLNEQTSLLVALVTEMNAELEETKTISTVSKIKAARIISALQWEATEMSMFIRGDTTSLIDIYQDNLNQIRACIGITGNEFDKACLDGATLEFLQSAENLGHRLTEFD